MGRHDYNPGRWVCVKGLDQCDGTKRIYGEKRPCPLAGKCVDDPRNRYEFPLTRIGTSGRFAEYKDLNWNKRHAAELDTLIWCFAPEIKLERARKARADPAKREQENRRQRERAAKKRQAREEQRYLPEEEEEPLDKFGPGARHKLLPCGEDCRNCPKGGYCKYTDPDEDELYLKEYPTAKVWSTKSVEAREKKRKQELEWQRKKRAERRAAGICTECGKAPARKGGYRCERCYTKAKMSRRKRDALSGSGKVIGVFK